MRALKTKQLTCAAEALRVLVTQQFENVRVVLFTWFIVISFIFTFCFCNLIQILQYMILYVFVFEETYHFLKIYGCVFFSTTSL